jgi:peptide/nickel transport system permease protein
MSNPTTDVVAGGAEPAHFELKSDEPVKSIQGRSPWQLAWARLRHDRAAMISLGVIALMVLLAVTAPVFAHITHHGRDEPFRHTGLDPYGQPQSPNGVFWFGTDLLGRDLLVRTFYGARVSLIAGVLSTLLATGVGVIIGLMAGYLGVVVDTVLARVIDVVLSLPYLLVSIAIISITGHGSLTIAILIIAFFSWASVARVVRGQVLSIREREFVEAARSLGAGSMRIMFVDVLPNVLAQVIVYASLLVPTAIVFEATLSYLGLGIPAPTPSWGNMLNEAQGYVNTGGWWYLVFPGLCLLATTFAFNLLGDGIRDAFDPRGDRTFAAGH